MPSELELELIQSKMAQKPMLRGEVGTGCLKYRSLWQKCGRHYQLLISEDQKPRAVGIAPFIWLHHPVDIALDDADEKREQRGGSRS